MIEKILAELNKRKSKFTSVRVDYAEGLHDGYMNAIKIVQEVAKEYGKDTNVRSNGWIPVEEGLPKDNQSMLVITKTGTIWTAFYDTFCETWIDNVTDNVLDVIAWQPLPAPFKKGE